MNEPYSGVRVRRLRRAPEEYDDFGSNLRPPAVGDEGIVVDVHIGSDGRRSYIVESMASVGTTAWIATLDESEIESSAKGRAPIAAGGDHVEPAPNAGAGQPERWLTPGAVALGAGVVAGVFGVVAVSGWAVLSFYPPASAAGAGLRMGLLMAGIGALGTLATGGSSGEATVTGLVTGLTFSVVGALAWATLH